MRRFLTRLRSCPSSTRPGPRRSGLDGGGKVSSRLLEKFLLRLVLRCGGYCRVTDEHRRCWICADGGRCGLHVCGVEYVGVPGLAAELPCALAVGCGDSRKMLHAERT